MQREYKTHDVFFLSHPVGDWVPDYLKFFLTNKVVNLIFINEWSWVSYEELWRSIRVLSVEALGRGG